MSGQCIADGGTWPGDAVQDAVRQSCLRGQLGEPQRRQRRLRSGLQHNGIARRQRRPQLPGRDDQRVVPGHDRGNDADRFAGNERQGLGAGWADLPEDLVDQLGVPLERRSAARHVDRQRVADRLADVERLEQRELLAIATDQLRESEEDALAVLRRLVGPAAIIECGPGRRDRPVDVGRVALGDVGDRPAVARRDIGKRPT